MSRRRFAFVTTLASSVLFANAALAGINFVGAELLDVANPDVILTGDLNGDNRADMVVVSSTSREVDTFVAADTPSRFAPSQTLRVGQKPTNAALGDLNADGRLDLAVADRAADSIFILLGNGEGGFLQPIQVAVPDSRRPVAVAIGNFDDAGSNDIAVADDRRGKVSILLNDNGTPPAFRRGGELDVGDAPGDVRSVDMNGDGKSDILTVNFGGPPVKEVAIFLWRRVIEGFPEFEPAQRFLIGEKPEEGQLVTSDFNNDDIMDVAMLNRARASDGVSEVDVLLGRGEGVLLPPTPFQVTCPFFTGGAPCRSLALSAADYDSNGTIDLAITITDPRASSGSSSALVDAMQVFSGRGDGTFLPGPVFTTQKNPAAIGSGDVTGDGPPDIVVANKRTLDLQLFVNVSSTGSIPIGDECLLGEECISDRCINGVCCVAACNTIEHEQCNIPGREGTCIPVPDTPIECAEPGPDPPECDLGLFCVDGFCCDEECVGGRCALENLIGVCIPGIPPGEGCSGDDAECTSRNCADNFICCLDPTCDGGRCDAETGTCRALLPLAEPCNENDDCESNVCDEFDGICCNRQCDSLDEICFPGEGICRSITYTPRPATGSPTATITPTPRATPAPNGESCANGPDCGSGNCVNTVCCEEPSCGENRHCEAGTGVCIDGQAPGSPTPTLIPTPLPTLPTANPCGGCPQGYRCVGDVCVITSSSGGCSTAGDDPAQGNLVVMSLLPLALWMGRRWQLQRARIRKNPR